MRRAGGDCPALSLEAAAFAEPSDVLGREVDELEWCLGDARAASLLALATVGEPAALLPENGTAAVGGLILLPLEGAETEVTLPLTMLPPLRVMDVGPAPLSALLDRGCSISSACLLKRVGFEAEDDAAAAACAASAPARDRGIGSRLAGNAAVGLAGKSSVAASCSA